MPRVLRIMNRLAVGGPVLNATYLTRYLAPDFETLLVVGERESHEKSADHLVEQLGIDYTVIPQMGRSISPADDFKAYHTLKKLIKDFQPDIVHTHAAKPGALGRLAAAAMKVPVVVHTFHGHVFHSYFNSFKTNFYIQTERYLARKSDAIVTISDQQKRELVYDFKIAPEDKFHVIRLGLDLDRFQEKQEVKRRKFRQEYGLEKDDIAIGIIGRLVPIKNHGVFLRALAHVLANRSKKVKAFIIGDGETRDELEAQARSLGISFTTQSDFYHPHPLVFTSWRTDVDVINAGLDIMALTSLNEGTPVSLIEAQAADKPVVSTRVGGIQDIVIEGETALLADIDDEASFHQHLLALVNDDALRHRLGHNSSQYVLERFGYRRLMNEMSALYYQLLHQKRNPDVLLQKEVA
ncbi:glycosyltransferase [Chitinophagaceae bacterium LB-8]|uniref:Glycosyltransferase n=1 Tax=Paraflavisolibacter caeni TaxID=2982496 RepID=A0A9X2XPM7_9BACT|nr:glycosyltransferase [Paraflavisolibacter caeni]MCU7551309.1 glycosyltransferase [Paraflavisolibacter caeni]